MRSKEYAALVKAYDEIDIKTLSNEELQHYAGLCNNGLLEADKELYKRKLL